ncbi:putative alcohol dehydrogenase protein [Neofusicoccum parvum UCRNP2]|uniref:Putative alcohol dehydrogenase protein n=1 Tax=Botryosphaeria parva (strain UCR-NP2) TaxID=1287680 RepID=R1EIF6_BOTPV|nr:putative alcohol dehydrogenase protein [Neofusicoccum parvum UCRNP2]
MANPDTAPITSRALVSRGPFSQGQWAVEDVTLRELKPDELVVEIVASGICHTDLHCGDTPADAGVPAVYYPRVLGHEGSGYAVRVGSGVAGVAPGDPVLLSFSYCGACHVCRTGPPSHCKTFFDINFMGEPAFVEPGGGAEATIGGRFFGQSSFAKHTIVSDKCVVNVRGLGLERADLRLLAPLGCGLQTGSGTVINVAKAGADDAVAVVGMGGVGLAAVMAAKNQKCKAIIGIDRVESRLELAKSLGATHVINTSSMSIPKLVEAVRAASDGLGATVSIDTSAHPPLVAAQIEFTRYMGKIIQVGTGMPDANLSIHMQSFMVSGKQYFGAVQGHSRTKDYIPQMIKWWKDGIFPVEKLVQFFDISDFESAVKVMGNGSVVKPIIVW